MLCRKKLSPLRRRIRRYLVLLLAVFIAAVCYAEIAVKAQLRDVIIRDMRTVSVQAVNTAVDEFLSENFDIGEKLTDISYDGGRVSAIAVNPSYVNYIKTRVTSRAQEQIDYLSHHNGVSEHLGSFTGLIFLSGAGPVIGFNVDSAQTVSCEFESSFESAGLNQTLHHIIMTVTVELTVYNPFRIRQAVTTTTSYEIAQTVIVGAVPSYGGVLSYSGQ